MMGIEGFVKARRDKSYRRYVTIKRARYEADNIRNVNVKIRSKTSLEE
jgi:hypothetical protein